MDHIPSLGRYPSLAGREMLWCLHFSYSTALRVTTLHSSSRESGQDDPAPSLGQPSNFGWSLADPEGWSCPHSLYPSQVAAGHSQQWLPVHLSTSNWTTLHFHGQKSTKYQQINTNKCRSSSFPTPLPCSSGITWWDYCLELSDWFSLIYSWFSAKGIYRERQMLLLLTESKPQYTTSHQTNQGLCFVITTSLPLTSNTKENYKLWNKPIN